MNMTAWFPYVDNQSPAILECIKNGPEPQSFSLIVYCEKRYKDCNQFFYLYQLEAA